MGAAVPKLIKRALHVAKLNALDMYRLVNLFSDYGLPHLSRPTAIPARAGSEVNFAGCGIVKSWKACGVRV